MACEGKWCCVCKLPIIISSRGKGSADPLDHKNTRTSSSAPININRPNDQESGLWATWEGIRKETIPPTSLLPQSQLTASINLSNDLCDKDVAIANSIAGAI
jgi:hypothetical protein